MAGLDSSLPHRARERHPTRSQPRGGRLRLHVLHSLALGALDQTLTASRCAGSPRSAVLRRNLPTTPRPPTTTTTPRPPSVLFSLEGERVHEG